MFLAYGHFERGVRAKNNAKPLGIAHDNGQSDHVVKSAVEKTQQLQNQAFGVTSICERKSSKSFQKYDGRDELECSSNLAKIAQPSHQAKDSVGHFS